MKNHLESLINPMSRTDFLENYKNNKPVIAHGILDDSSELRELPFLKSLENLLIFWPTEVSSYLPGIADEGNSKKVSTSEAKKLFHEGSGLCFDDANNFSPILQQWAEELRSDLGLSQLTYCRSLIYAIKNGKGTAPHFDQNINFVIQISGTKKWWVAPNTHVENPLTRHTIGIDIDPELASYSTYPMPDSFPENASEFILKPGSMLFVPRGAWHKTEAGAEDAISLNFTFTAPSWIDILCAAMRGRLAQSSQWRETADFVSDDLLYPQALDKFNILLSELAEDIPNWNANDILGATEMRDFI